MYHLEAMGCQHVHAAGKRSFGNGWRRNKGGNRGWGGREATGEDGFATNSNANFERRRVAKERLDEEDELVGVWTTEKEVRAVRGRLVQEVGGWRGERLRAELARRSMLHLAHLQHLRSFERAQLHILYYRVVLLHRYNNNVYFFIAILTTTTLHSISDKISIAIFGEY